MLKQLYNHFLIRWISVSICVGVSDWVWTRYISSVAGGNRIVAANYSVVVIALGAYVVLSYVQDRKLVLAAAIGAWIGTYLGT